MRYNMELSLEDRLGLGGDLVGFLDDNAQKRITKILKKMVKEKGINRTIEECAVTMRSLANEIYKARKS